MIALCDHNSARNARSFAAACRNEGVVPVFGIEASSIEEVHLLCLFPDVAACESLGAMLEERLQTVALNPALMGDQAAVDEEELLIESPQVLLTAATSLSIEEIEALVHERGGLFIPAHVDRATFSVWSQLGFLPDGSYDAVEVVTPTPAIDLAQLPRVASSDAHAPEQIGRRSTRVSSGACSFDGLRQALRAGDVQPQFRALSFRS